MKHGGYHAFRGESAAAIGGYPQAAYPAFDDAAESELTFFDAAKDSLPTEGLAAALVRRSRRPIWLRLGPQDRDPGTFLVSLASAAARFGTGNVTLELMRSKPGPVYGWASLFAGLGAEMGGRLSQGGALVLENVQHSWDRRTTFTLLSTELLPALPRAAPCVLVGCGNPPHGVPSAWVRRSGGDLRLPRAAARRTLDEIDLPLSRHAHERVTTLRSGRLSSPRSAPHGALPVPALSRASSNGHMAKRICSRGLPGYYSLVQARTGVMSRQPNHLIAWSSGTQAVIVKPALVPFESVG